MPKISIETLTQLQRVRILYKTILRLHKGLPNELQELGTQYVRDEFKRHKKCSPLEANLFMTEWTKYALDLSKQLGIRGKSTNQFGNPLDENIIEQLRDDQIVQLYELMNAATGAEDEKQIDDKQK